MKPICVYSSPRVGSTALTADLASKYCLPNLSEIFNNTRRELDPIAEELISTKQPFVWAFKPLSYTEDNQKVVDSLIAKSTIIKMIRQDIAAQIVSYYLMVKHKPLDFCVNIVCRCNKLVDVFDAYDKIIVYEDYVYTDTCGILPSAKPDNYKELIEQTKYILEQKGIANV